MSQTDEILKNYFKNSIIIEKNKKSWFIYLFIYFLFFLIKHDFSNHDYRYRYLCPTSADSGGTSVGKERFEAVIRCFQVIGFKSQVRNIFYKNYY